MTEINHEYHLYLAKEARPGYYKDAAGCERVDEWVQEHFRMFPSHVYCMECEEFFQDYGQHFAPGMDGHLMVLSYAQYQFQKPKLVAKLVMERLRK